MQRIEVSEVLFDMKRGSPEKQYNTLRDKGILTKPVNSFFRFDRIGKVFFLLVAEVLSNMKNQDNDVDLSKTALLGVDRNGALQANTRYFNNYKQNSKKMGSPHDFIYTLPTSLLSSISIYFQIKGPTFYMSSVEDDLYAFALDQANEIVQDPDYQNVLVLINHNNCLTVCFVSKKRKA